MLYGSRSIADWHRPTAPAEVGVPTGSAGLPSSHQLRRRFDLTPREAEVALALAVRRTNEEIAAELDVSEHTARHHTQHVLRKLRITSRRDVYGVITAAFRLPSRVGSAA